MRRLRFYGSMLFVALAVPASVSAQDPATTARLQAHMDREKALVATANAASAQGLDLRLNGQLGPAIAAYRKAAEAMQAIVMQCSRIDGPITYGCAYDENTLGAYVFDLASTLRDAGKPAEAERAFDAAEAALAPRWNGCGGPEWGVDCKRAARDRRNFQYHRARYFEQAEQWEEALAIRSEATGAAATAFAACQADSCDDAADDLLSAYLAHRSLLAGAGQQAERLALDEQWLPRLASAPNFAKGAAAGASYSEKTYRDGVDALVVELGKEASVEPRSAALLAQLGRSDAVPPPPPGPDPREAVFQARLAENKAAYSKLKYGAYEEKVASRTERARIFADRYGEKSVEHADALQLLAFEHFAAKRWAEDARIRLQALAIRRELQGDAASDTLYAAYSTANGLAEGARLDDAVKLIDSILSAPGNDYTQRYGDPDQRRRTGNTVENKAMGRLRALHARLLLQQGRDPGAAAASAKLAALASRAHFETLGFSVADETLLELGEKGPTFSTGEEGFGEWERLYADALWASARRDEAAREEMLTALQVATAGTTSRALARSAGARYAAGAGAGALIAEREMLAEQIGKLHKRLAEGKLGVAEEEAMWRDAFKLGEQVEALDARIASAAPSYFELIRPRPLDAAKARSLMGPDEAALIIVPSTMGTHVLLVDREGTAWNRAELPEAELNQKVRRLLWDVGANVDATQDELKRWSAEGTGPSPFDRGTAHLLYRELVAPFAARLAKRKHLAIVASGGLSSLPFSLLVAEAPKGEDGDPAALRATSWLGDRFAMVQLPSLQSLQLLRSAAVAKGDGRGRFLGYGDPVLAGKAEERGLVSGQRRRSGSSVVAGVPASRTSDGLPIADVGVLRGLARLPGTAAELTAMSKEFPAGAATIRLAEAATEASLKRETLTGLSVLALATHGLLAGEASLAGVSETGLVLTPPEQASKRDDGLLTASEVAALRTDAEWVVLSACNTAAGDGSMGAEGLSGLARSFFFAGAQSLLASHWPVRDDVAAVMTVKILQLQREHPDWSRAKALQAAMQWIRDNTDADALLETWAHPNAWAPFTVIGDPSR